MLRKLIKYDLLADYKKYAALFSAMLMSSVVMLIFDKMTSLIRNNMFVKAMSAVFTALFFVLAIVAGVMLLVFSTVRFYKNIVRDEGYLMHTLPVSTWQLLASKLISVYIWFAALIVVSGICSGIAFGEPLWLFKVIKEYGSIVPDLREHLSAEETEAVLRLIGYCAVTFVFSPVYAMSNIYLSFALGNLFSRSKLAMSVVMYFAIRVAEQILASIITMIVTADKFLIMVTEPEAEVPVSVSLDFMSETLAVSIIFSTVLSIAYMIAAERIFSKKLNLE